MTGQAWVGMLLSLLLSAASAAAATLHVCPDGSGDYPHIRAAVDAAASGDEIELCEGEFTGLDNVEIDVGSKSLTFRSLHGDEATSIEAYTLDEYGDEHPHVAFILGPGTVTTIQGITINRAGNLDPTFQWGDGGAIRCVGGSVTLDRVRIIGRFPHSARRGGGVYIESGELFAVDCVLGGGAFQTGGAVHCENSTATITRCLITRGACGRWPGPYGGALWLGNGGTITDCLFHGGGGQCEDDPAGLGVVVAGGDAVIRGCRFYDNHDVSGAGLVQFATAGPLLIEDCIFEDCSSYSGACVTVDNATIRNTIFRRNLAGYSYAADLSCHGTVTLEGCIFDGSQGGGAGDHGSSVIAGLGITTMSHCTFVGARRRPAILLDSGAQLDIDHCILALGTEGASAIRCIDATATVAAACVDVFGNAGGDWVGCIAGLAGANGNLAVDPLFCNAAAGDFALRSTSPCAPAQSGACGLIGALPVACGPTATQASTWGSVKVLYR